MSTTEMDLQMPCKALNYTDNQSGEKNTQNDDNFYNFDEDGAYLFSSDEDGDDDVDYDSSEKLEDAETVIQGYASLGPPCYKCNKCEAWMWKEERCNKSIVKGTPLFSLCCAKGQIQLPKEPNTPSYIWRLHNDKEKGKRFKDGVRLYNSIFAFTSTGGKVDHSINSGGSPYVYRLNGQNHHLFGSLISDDGDNPKFCQLYIYDTQNEMSNRLNGSTPLMVIQLMLKL